MSLLSTTTKQLLGLVMFLLVVSCIAVVAYAMQSESQPQESAARQKRETIERQRETGAVTNWVVDREALELKQALERETDPEVRAKLEQRLRALQVKRQMGDKEALTISYAFLRDFRGAGLAAAKWAKIPMGQAIQIAVSQNPGSVMQCNLYGEREDKVVYEVVVLTGEEPNLGVTHVIVSAIDGSILKSAKETLGAKEKP